MLKNLFAVCKRHGVTLRPEMFPEVQEFLTPGESGALVPVQMALHGAGDKNLYHWLCTQKSELRNSLTMQLWLDELLAYYISKGSSLCLREGVEDVVIELAASGIGQSIVTSATRGQLEVCAVALKPIRQLFLFMLSSDDVTKSKPDPEGYLKAIARTGKPLDGQAAVEDSPTGVRAALSAQLPCVQFLLPAQSQYSPEGLARVVPVSQAADLPSALLHAVQRT